MVAADRSSAFVSNGLLLVSIVYCNTGVSRDNAPPHVMVGYGYWLW